MRPNREHAWFFWGKLCSACAVFAILCCQVADSPSVAQEPASQKRILLLYGDRRVEYVVGAVPPAGQSDPTASPSSHRSLVYPPQTGQPDPLFRPPLGNFTESRWNQGSHDSTSLQRGCPANAGLADGSRLGGLSPMPPQDAAGRDALNPLRNKGGELGLHSWVPSEEVDLSVPSSASARAEKADEPLASEAPATDKPGLLSGSAKELAFPVVSSALSAAREPISTGVPESLESAGSPSAPETGSSADWLALGVAQVVGTLIGLFIGMSVFVVVLFFVLRRTAGTKLEPTIRVVIPDLPLAAYGLRSSGGAREGWDYHPADAEPCTPVADFGDQVVPFRPPGKTYDEQQREKMAARKQQEEEILKQIFEENLALREKMSVPTGAA